MLVEGCFSWTNPAQLTCSLLAAEIISIIQVPMVPVCLHICIGHYHIFTLGILLLEHIDVVLLSLFYGSPFLKSLFETL